jgi:23S rRNA (guanosine2251-2'-O)-methyltransferase
MSFVHGFHPVREALRRRPHRIARVLIARRESGPRVREIAELCARHGIRLEFVDWNELRRIVSDARQGIAAEEAAVDTVSRGAPRSEHDERRADESSGDPSGSADSGPARRGVDSDLVVLLEDIQDPRNLGALLRVCEGAGAGRVLIRDRGAAPLTPTVVQASAGATEWLDVERVTNTVAELERLKEGGFWVYGAAEGGVPPWEIDLTGPIVLCFGGEAKGLRRLTRESCDRLVGLPMRGRVQSLNVATAASALLYEAVRQRTPPRTPRQPRQGALD